MPEPERMPRAVRPWLIVVFGLLVLGGAVVVVFEVVKAKKAATTTRAQTSASVAEARKERQRPALHVAPAPLPRALPLVGPDGKDADGYPTRDVDPAALRSLLHFGKYE